MFNGKKLIVIGGTGSIGELLVKKLLDYNPEVIRVFSRDEYKQFVMQDNLKDYKNIRYLLGDIRDKERLDTAMKGIDIVFNLAALKHVPGCEYNPFEAVKTNVIGTQNVIECAIKNRVEKVIHTSSDKAVSPTNTMGATKLVAERLISSADYSKGGARPTFAAVRFGNVIDSRGAVLSLWKKQIRENRKITVTDPDMTRFIITREEAISLILKACEVAEGGEIFVLKMPVIRLGDMAQAVLEEICKEFDINISEVKTKIIGLRPGEKVYEELMTVDESIYAFEYKDMFAIQPLTRYKSDHLKRSREYRSDMVTPITIETIRSIVRKILADI